MRSHSRSSLFVPVFLTTLAIVSATVAQAQFKDISAVFGEGKIEGRRYRNSYFGLELVAGQGEVKPGFISAQGQRARLVDVFADAQNWSEKYTLAVLADARAENPLVRSAEHYVGIVRRQFEKQGWETVRTETSVEISGKPFTEAILKGKADGRDYYRGMYTIFLNGYILSLDVTAATPDRVRAVAQIVRFPTP